MKTPEITRKDIAKWNENLNDHATIKQVYAALIGPTDEEAAKAVNRHTAEIKKLERRIKALKKGQKNLIATKRRYEVDTH